MSNTLISLITNLLKGRGDLDFDSCVMFFSIFTLAGRGRVLLRLLKVLWDEDDMVYALLAFVFISLPSLRELKTNLNREHIHSKV